MQKARRHPFPLRGIGLRLLVSTWFQVLLTPLIGVLFIVQSPYWFTIGREEYLALESGPPGFTRSSTSSVLLWYANRNGGLIAFAYGTITLYGATFQTLRLSLPL